MGTPLKDTFFQRPFFEKLASALRGVHPGFDRERFFALLYDDAWAGLELKGRMRHASEALGATLPADYRKALGLLRRVEPGFDPGFDHLLFSDFVERFGQEEPGLSLDALEAFTRSSSEFAVRPFIQRDPGRTLARMLAWTRHPSDKVRRLASEGCRPRLPWGMRLSALVEDPAPILPILEALRDDPSEDVRRSVANNLGDIAKDHPDLVVDLAARWLEEDPGREPLVRHALRSVLKKGHRRALHLFGVGAAPRVEVLRLALEPRRVPMGGTARLEVRLRSTARAAQKLRLEYELRYARATGRTSTKVFRIAVAELAAGAELHLARKVSFVDRSIRRHHPGAHAVTLIVNGHRMKTAGFRLVPAS